jgi:methyltransferase (TIGR00027 family)
MYTDAMETGRASQTALRVAQRRAVHQILDHPHVLDDPIAVPLLGPRFACDETQESSRIERVFRAFMVARSRYAEDRLAESVAQDIQQYVILGAGLDTFAYRNPFPQLRVFEVDFPATQEWKRSILAEAAIAEPENLVFVPLDFEHKTLAEGLVEAGFDTKAPAFFGWLGVVPYLTLEAFRSTLEAVARLPQGTGVCFDYGVPRHLLSPRAQEAFDALAARVAAAGEPFRIFFTPDELNAECLRAGFHRFQQHNAEDLNSLYFSNRADGLQVSSSGMGRMAAAWV